MKRRDFLKSFSAAGASAFLPSAFSLNSMYKMANAAIDYSSVNVVAPSVMPQVINIFLYGGPSELSGNLTNIVDINANSQNFYDANAAFGPEILVNDTIGDGSAGHITRHGFWRGTDAGGGVDNGGAGGRYMQFMLENNYMSVYRTIMKRLDGTRSHRESILMSLKGSLDVEGSAGMGTRIAAMLANNRTAYETGTLLADGSSIPNIENLLLPFVSLEGDTRLYQPDPDYTLPLLFRGITLDDSFDNPFSRNFNPNDAELNALVSKVVTTEMQERFRGVSEAFELRGVLEQRMKAFDANELGQTVSNTTDSSGNPLPTLAGADATANGGAQLAYPNNSYRDRIRAAVTLAVENPSTLFISVGGGLGGWDDHNNGVNNYGDRMSDLFRTLQAAMMHIKYSNGTTPGGITRTTTDNIIINVFGDFGRRVNLNNSEGWDHGNNQNLFTFGGAAVRPGGMAALGKVVGVTERVGDGGTNNQVTEPAAGSYEAEPMSVAASVYGYFGAQTPAVPSGSDPSILTADPEFNPAGVPALDEAQPMAPNLPLF